MRFALPTRQVRSAVAGSDTDVRESAHVTRAFMGRIGIAVVAPLAVLVFVGAIVGGHSSLACQTCHDPRIDETYRASSHSSVPCTSCHSAYSAFGGLGGVMHSVEGLVPGGGARATSVTVTSEACVKCHAAAALQVKVSRGVRMSHVGLAEAGYACVDCHEGVVHGVPEGKLPVPTMGMCTKCHDGAKAPSTCDTCHPDRAADSGKRLGDAEWAITHGSDWQRTHGLGDLTTCSACHTADKCAKCHNTQLPHPADFGITHGHEAIRAGAASCRMCHTTAFCASCHGIDMPHPTGFLKQHSTVASGIEDKRCMVCHVSANCNECHERHAHPGSKHRFRAPTNMYEAKPK